MKSVKNLLSLASLLIMGSLFVALANSTVLYAQGSQDKNPAITKVKKKDDTFRVSGTGKANTQYILKFAQKVEPKVSTDDKGSFSIDLPQDAPRFGIVELIQDTNGRWPGGKKTLAKKYYAALVSTRKLSDDKIDAIVGEVFFQQDELTIAGYYLPSAKLILSSNGKEIAKTSVSKDGYFKFTDIKNVRNFTQVAIDSQVKSGWFGTKREGALGHRYVNAVSHQLSDKLPITTKQEVVKESIANSSRDEQTPDLPLGQRRVAQVGMSGERTIVYSVTYEGDKEIKRDQVQNTVTLEPVEQINQVGTYVYSAQQDTVSNGATALCRDGSPSYSQHRQGTCSHHGGVSIWY